MIMLVILISLEVMLRFFFNAPLDWIGEVAVLLFIWMSMIGAAAAVPAGTHMVLAPLSGRVSPAASRVLNGFVTTSIVGFGIFLLISGLGNVASVSHQVLTVTRIPTAWEAAAFPVAGALFVAFALVPAVRTWFRRNKTRPSA
ncbi:MAG: TRAP transporter small permease [Vulcanimicrobiaceae bacterium]